MAEKLNSPRMTDFKKSVATEAEPPLAEQVAASPSLEVAKIKHPEPETRDLGSAALACAGCPLARLGCAGKTAPEASCPPITASTIQVEIDSGDLDDSSAASLLSNKWASTGLDLISTPYSTANAVPAQDNLPLYSSATKTTPFKPKKSNLKSRTAILTKNIQSRSSSSLTTGPLAATASEPFVRPSLTTLSQNLVSHESFRIKHHLTQSLEQELSVSHQSLAPEVAESKTKTARVNTKTSLEPEKPALEVDYKKELLDDSTNLVLAAALRPSKVAPQHARLSVETPPSQLSPSNLTAKKVGLQANDKLRPTETPQMWDSLIEKPKELAKNQIAKPVDDQKPEQKIIDKPVDSPKSEQTIALEPIISPEQFVTAPILSELSLAQAKQLPESKLLSNLGISQIKKPTADSGLNNSHYRKTNKAKISLNSLSRPNLQTSQQSVMARSISQPELDSMSTLKPKAIILPDANLNKSNQQSELDGYSSRASKVSKNKIVLPTATQEDSQPISVISKESPSKTIHPGILYRENQNKNDNNPLDLLEQKNNFSDYNHQSRAAESDSEFKSVEPSTLLPDQLDGVLEQASASWQQTGVDLLRRMFGDKAITLLILEDKVCAQVLQWN